MAVVSGLGGVPTVARMQSFSDVTVAVELPGRLGAEVTAFVEAEAGWHAVAADGPLVPVLRLASAPGAAIPTVVVRDAPVSSSDLRDALLGGALDVVAWPDDRARLLDLPARMSPAGPAVPSTPTLTVGGCRGGVGTSTVALTVAATVAWSGGSAVVVGGSGMVRLAGLGPWRGAGSAELASLGRQAAAEVERIARPVPGVDGLHVLGGGAAAVRPSGWPYDLVVVDAGVDGSAHLVVGAADGSLDEADGSADVVVVEHGPLDRGGVRRRLGRSPVAWLPYSARVARAGTAGRVPSALPGSWVAAVRGTVRAASQS